MELFNRNKKTNLYLSWVLLLPVLFWSNHASGEESLSHMINIPYVDSALTKALYKNNLGSEKYKTCKSIMKELERGGKNISVIQPKVVNEKSDKKVFKTHLPDCNLDDFITTAESGVHKAENAKGEMQSYWTTSGTYFRSDYYVIYDTTPVVLYIGRGKKINNSEISEKYVGPGRFKLIQKNGCHTIDSFANGGGQESDTPESSSRVVEYNGNIYMYKNDNELKRITVLRIEDKKFKLMCSFHKEYNNKGKIK